jgi:hypothetical protein
VTHRLERGENLAVIAMRFTKKMIHGTGQLQSRVDLSAPSFILKIGKRRCRVDSIELNFCSIQSGDGQNTATECSNLPTRIARTKGTEK